MFTRNYRLLAYFVEVVNCGSVRGAAANLFVSAPVVSKAIADLEESLNTTLLRREHRRVTLTPEGREVYTHALDMTQAAVTALGSVAATPETVSGHLEINLPTELASAWLPSVLQRFNRLYPEVSVEIFASDQTTEAHQQKQQIVIRSDFRTRRPAAGEAYFSSLPLCVACHPDLVGKPAADLQRQLAAVPFIGFSQTDKSNTLSALIKKTGREVTLSFNGNTYVNNAQVIKEMVLRGYGAGLLTRQSVQHELDRDQLTELGPGYSFGYICQRLIFRDKYPSAAARAFRDLVTDSPRP